MRTYLLILSITFLVSGCAHKFMRGTVAMKTDDSTAHICLGDNDVKIGDKVNFYRNRCTGGGGGVDDGAERDCELEVLGSGEVTKILNKHYSEVKTSGSFKFSEGTLIQRQ